MSRRKVERLLNLTLALMATRRYLTVTEIGRLVEGYDPEDGEAFRRMFERDKEDLRDLGIPLETGSHSVWEDEPGYRIARRDYALPDITLEPDEAAALGLAARLWSAASLADDTSRALAKLRAAGADPLPPPPGLDARVDATEPALRPFLDAVRAGQAVTFTYRAAGAAEPATRHLEPWGVVSWRGRWYAVGHDRDREATRVFRLSRVAGTVRPEGPPNAVQPPTGFDMRAAIAAHEPTGGQASARVRVRPGAAHALRRRATRTEPGPDGDLLVVPYSDAERLAELLAGFGSDVVALDPPELREAVVRRLRAVVAAAGAGARS